MCVIVDNNVVGLFLGDARFASVRERVSSGKCCCYFGGTTQLAEYPEQFTDILVEFDRAGKAKVCSASRVDAEEVRVRPLCVSDDPHVIALARVSGARLLCTDDVGLMTDFKDKKLIDKPRGSVYRGPSHNGLLRTHCLPCS